MFIKYYWYLCCKSEGVSCVIGATI